MRLLQVSVAEEMASLKEKRDDEVEVGLVTVK